MASGTKISQLTEDTIQSGDTCAIRRGGTNYAGTIGDQIVALETLLSQPTTSFSLSEQVATGDAVAIDNGGLIAGSGTYGGGISFSRLGSTGRRRAGIAGVQTEGDADRMGLAFFGHSSVGELDDLDELMRLTHDGYLSIGTTSPVYELDVAGQIALQDPDVAHGLTSLLPSANYAKLGPASGAAGGSRLISISDTDANAFELRAIIGSANPTDTIPAILLAGGKSDGATNWATLGNSETLLRLDNYTTPVVTVLGSGNVGIGTTSPNDLLHVSWGSFGGTDLSLDSFVLESGTNASLSFNSPGTTVQSIYFRDDADTASGATGWVRYSHASDLMTFRVAGSDALAIDSSGNVGIGTTGPTELLDVNSDSFRLRSSQTPASASATGTQGQICWDTNYLYVCTATDTWKRAALATW